MTRETLSLQDELADARARVLTVRDSGTKAVLEDGRLRHLLDATLAYIEACQEQLGQRGNGWD